MSQKIYVNKTPGKIALENAKKTRPYLFENTPKNQPNRRKTMKREEIYNKTSMLIASHLNTSTESITEETTLESLGADSLDHIEIVMDIEEEFMIEIADSEHENIRNVKGFVDLVEKKLNGK